MDKQLKHKQSFKRLLKMSLGQIGMLLCVLLLSTQSAFSGTYVLVQGQSFYRQSGKPVKEIVTFTARDTASQYTFNVYNGGLEGYDAIGKPVSSSTIKLNGVMIFSPNEFNKNVTALSKQINVNTSNTISLTLKGKPGGAISIDIMGVDNDLPVITASVNPVANTLGWHKNQVVVSFECDDAASGIASCTSPITLDLEGAAQSITGTAVDVAGNQATTTVVINLDKTNPAISASIVPAPNAANWNNTDLTVNFNCTDNLSGVLICTDAVSINTEGAAQTVSGAAQDKADNTSQTDVIVNLDKTLPDINVTQSPLANTRNWNNGDVLLNYTCQDALSGIDTCPANKTIYVEGAGQIVTDQVLDVAGNLNSVDITLSIDKTIPGITASSVPPANEAGWNNTDVTVSYTCTDELSGIFSCTDSQLVSTEGTAQVLTGTAVDNADNTAQTTFALNMDKTLPSISSQVTPAANINGWHNTDPTVDFTCNDALSGINTCTTSVTVFSEGFGQSVAGVAIDIAGNAVSTSAAINLDKTPPVITASVVPAANLSGWNNTYVTVNFTCSDALSGIESCPAPQTILFDTLNQLVSGTATDIAGNSTEASVTINIDTIAASINAVIAPASNTAGWNNTDTTVSFDCVDDASGVASCTAAIAVITEGINHTFTGEVVDNAGNVSSTTVGLKIDKTLPTITSQVAEPNVNGWYNTDPVITYSCSDALSGISNCTAPVTLSTEGANQAISGTADDIAGNSNTISTSFNVDKTAPTITATAVPVANASGWNNTAVNVSFTCSDVLSGVEVCPAAVLVNLEGANQSVNGTAVDRAGNTANTTLTINIDKTQPAISVAASPAANAAGWYNSDTTLTYTCNDALSGIAACPASQPVSLEGLAQNFTGEAIDTAGNNASTSITVNVDKTAPTITAQLNPLPNSNGWSNSDVQVSYTCNDTLSGMASCTSATTVSLEGAAQTQTGTATDIAGNNANTTVTLNIDKTAPTLSFVSPADNSAQTQNPPPVTLNVNDNLVIDSASLEITVNSIVVTANCQITGTQAQCILPQAIVGDTATIGASIKDMAANSATASTSFAFDSDGDGHINSEDVFPNDPNEWADLDGDGIGNNSDPDRDGDGISNDYETQAGTDPDSASSVPPDMDGDGIPDTLDDDRDGDGVLNTNDVFPNDAAESADLDGDGIGDNADTDRDGDGISNDYETQTGTDPSDASSVPPDLDGDAIPDTLDDDRDGDGVLNTNDVFPNDATESADLDGDGIGDNADTDRDGDGISNDYETQAGTDPDIASSVSPDLDSDGIPDSLDNDRDGDGVDNASDIYPDDATRSQLPAVTGLQATLQNQSVQVQWQALTGEPVTGYNLYRNTAVDAAWVKLNTTPLTTTSFTDSNIISGTGYRYQVAAQANNASEGISSTAVELFVAFNNTTISGFTANLMASTVELNWTAVTGVEYQIYRGNDGATATLLTTVNTASYTDSNLTAVSSADYQVATVVEYTDSFANTQVVITGPLSEKLSVTITQLEVNLTGTTTGTDGIAEIVANQATTVLLSGQYLNATGDVNVTASSSLGNVNQISNNGSFLLELPATQTAVWQIVVKENDSQRSVSTQVRVLKDTQPPVITIDGDAEQNISADKIVLTGDVSDNASGVKSVTFSSDRYTGVKFAALITDQRYSIEIPLQLGANNLTATALDNIGSSARASVKVNREIPAAPKVEITSPATGSSTASSQITLTGLVYSSQASDVLRVEFNSVQIFPTATSQAGIHIFSFNNVNLQPGINNLSVRVDSPLGSDVTQTQVSYSESTGTETIADPVISVQSPTAATVIDESITTLTLRGTASSTVGIASIQVNGNIVSLGGADQTNLDFAYNLDLSSVADGNIEFTIVAVDTRNVSTTTVHTLYKDSIAPTLSLTDTTLQLAPEINTVTSNPYTLSGTIVDKNIAGFSINGQSVDLLPGASADQYTFEAQLILPVQTEQGVQLIAWDNAGHVYEMALILLADTSVGIEFIEPVNDAQILVQGATYALPVTARLSDWLPEHIVTVAYNQTAAEVMTVTNGSASHTLNIPTDEGRHSINIKVENSTGKVLSESAIFINVVNADLIPLQVNRVDPANEATGIEPHLPITVYFNRPIDRTKIAINVFETVTGLTYDLDAMTGKTSLENQQVGQVEIDRNHEAVAGGLSFYPQDTFVTFYPGREFAYGANVYIEVVYDGETLSHLSYSVRELPTFITGGVIGNNNIGIQGLKVSLPELNREAVTNKNGNYGFGFKDNANNTLPAGRYRIVINPNLENIHYGTLERWVSIQKGRIKNLPVEKVQILSENVPFSRISSQSNISLFGNELVIDATAAELRFPNGRLSGDVHVQFIQFSDLPYSSMARAMPHWMFGVQPMGIKVSGPVQLNLAMPPLYGNHDYLPPEGTLVVMLGYNSNAQQLLPVGVGSIQNRHVVTSVAVQLDELSYIGYALSTQQALLQDYIDGNIGLDALIAGVY